MSGDNDQIDVTVSDSEDTEIASNISENDYYHNQYVIMETNDDYINGTYEEYVVQPHSEPHLDYVLAIKGSRKTAQYLVSIAGARYQSPVWMKRVDIKRPENIDKIKRFKLDQLKKKRAERKIAKVNENLNVEPEPSDTRDGQHDEETCLLCMTRLEQLVNMPCTHVTSCRICGKQVKTCPVCRKK